ncbi:MAG: hypothetical protein WCP29_10910 [Acidobacteriota bacterium]
MTIVSPRTSFVVAAAVCLLVAAGHAQQGATSTTPLNDLDAFMAKVLERRNDNWRTLHDYILSERERVVITGPAGVRLEGLDREFGWFVRDGYLVRSPVRANGVTVRESERRQYEEKWLAEEKRREQRQKARAARNAPAEAMPPPTADLGTGEVVKQSGEPRFISEAYFMRFPFEPGNYYVAGRATIEGLGVVIVEYYPSRLFRDRHSRPQQDAAGKPTPGSTDSALEDDIRRSMNKVTKVTMWIDPEERQIVKYTFDNADFGFLPARALVRVDQAQASMTMGRQFDNVWLPKDISLKAEATLATGSYRFTYDRTFYDYRKGEVSARIRAYVPKDDK